MADFAGERINRLAGPVPLLPAGECGLEGAVPFGARDVDIVIARDGGTRRQRPIADAERRGCCRHLGVEAEHGRIAGKDDVVETARGEIAAQHIHHRLGVSKATTATEQVDVDPAGGSLAEYVADSPPEPPGGEMNVGEVGQLYHC